MPSPTQQPGFTDAKDALDALDEPLLEAAALAARLAPTTCRGCAAYHGFWPTLRAIGLAAAPTRHHDFFHDAMGECAAAGRRRVLVSGAADQGMLAQVAAAYDARTSELDATVVDVCPTPLALCATYARDRDLAVRTVAADVVTFEPDHPFDVVCTHSLLPIFRPAERPALLAAWRRLLRPGGRLVTVARVGGEPGADPNGFGALVAERADVWAPRLGCDADDLVAAARRYAAQTVVEPLRSADELAGLVGGAGLEVERLDMRKVGGVTRGDRAAAGAARAATYAELVAVRP